MGRLQISHKISHKNITYIKSPLTLVVKGLFCVFGALKTLKNRMVQFYQKV